ncbi:MAG: aspartate carbamoyltransferase regulatory subunit [archaeon]|nr:aspartate carbamoyltransferase regulatory subunit [archaeon]
MKKEIRIQPIKNGTVIDHLNVGSVYRILQVLDLSEFALTAAMNVESRKLGKKDILFIEGKELNDKELNKIALIGKGASVNIIKDAEIKKKFQLGYPEKVEAIIKCINPKCITNSETLSTKFTIKTEPLEATCYYCETRMNEKEIVESIKK